MLLYKVSLNSDGQQFHQYHQTVPPPITYNHGKQKIPQYMMLDIQVLACDRHKNVAVVKLSNEISMLFL